MAARSEPVTSVTPHLLDSPARASLEGPHAHLAERRGRVLRYPPDVAPFVTLPVEPTPEDWRDLGDLIGGPGTTAMLPGLVAPVPPDWEIVLDGVGVQMLGADVQPAEDAEAVLLGAADVPEMLALVARTEPGPFRTRTVEMGTYLGIRREGQLIAMAGERLHPPGWTEISAVCTDAAHRGQGLAGRLVRAVAAGIRARGEVPFLHARATNHTAISLYETLGFRLRKHTRFVGVRVP